MKKAFKLVAVFLAAAAVQLSAVAAPIVDQINPDRLAGFCFLNDAFACGQSFRQDHANISGAGIFIDPAYGDGSNGTLTLSIFSAYNGGAPSGLIASGTASGVNPNSGWVDVFFAPAALSVGTQYFLIAQSTNSIVASFGQPTYTGGNAVYFGSTTAYSSYDLTFRTYFDDANVQVPEPGSFALLAIGIAGLGFALRKQRGQ